MRNIAILIVLLFTSGVWAESENPSCRDERGSKVGWWVILKVPGSLYDYVYRDANSSPCLEGDTSCWGNLRSDLSEVSRGPLALTLRQIYHPKAQPPAFLMYNDETLLDISSDSHANYAHAKGMLAANMQGGFWMLHSIPRFPTDVIGEPYSGLPSNGRVYGQMLLCLSLDLSQLKIVGEQLRLAYPFVYQKSGFTEQLLNKLGPDMRDLLSDIEVPETRKQQSRAKTILSIDGKSWTSFSKSKYWENDLYDALIAPKFDSDLLVNSWTNGPGTLPTACAHTSCKSRRFPNRRNVCSRSCAEDPQQCIYRYDVVNVRRLQIDNIVAWPNEKEHAKWAITVPSAKTRVACIGDINRQNGQRYRGGGALCIADGNLWQAFYSLIAEADQCMALNHLDQRKPGSANLPSDIDESDPSTLIQMNSALPLILSSGNAPQNRPSLE